jgi:hypothetical protein
VVVCGDVSISTGQTTSIDSYSCTHQWSALLKGHAIRKGNGRLSVGHDVFGDTTISRQAFNDQTLAKSNVIARQAIYTAVVGWKFGSGCQYILLTFGKRLADVANSPCLNSITPTRWPGYNSENQCFFSSWLHFTEGQTDFEPAGCLDLFSHCNDCTDRFMAGNLRQSRLIHPAMANMACINERTKNHNVIVIDSPFPDLIVSVAPTSSADLDEEIVVAILWNRHFDNVEVLLKLCKKLMPLG